MHMKSFSISLIIKEMQNKSISIPLATTKMAITGKKGGRREGGRKEEKEGGEKEGGGKERGRKEGDREGRRKGKGGKRKEGGKEGRREGRKQVWSSLNK